MVSDAAVRDVGGRAAMAGTPTWLTSRVLWSSCTPYRRRARTTGDQRSFGSGFITASCSGMPPWKAARDEPALGSFTTIEDPLQCSEWVATPTVVIQHDDIGKPRDVWTARTQLLAACCVWVRVPSY